MHARINAYFKSSVVALALASPLASAQGALVGAADRYLDAFSKILYEPCLIYDGVAYSAQFVVEHRIEDGLHWALVSGEELTEIPSDCETVQASVLTDDPSIPYVSYNIENVIIAVDGIDTGLRYDVGSRADASRLDLGFGFDTIFERRVEEKVILTGGGSVSFPGPSSFPFDVENALSNWIGVSKNFDGSLTYDGEANEFTVTFDEANAAGDYELTVRFNEIGFGLNASVGLVVVYPLEFHVI